MTRAKSDLYDRIGYHPLVPGALLAFQVFRMWRAGGAGWVGWTALVLLALWLGVAIANSITRGRVLTSLDSDDDDDDGDDKGWAFGDALRSPRAFAQAFGKAFAGRKDLASVTLDSAASAAAVEGLLDDAQRDAVDALRLAAQIDPEPLLRALTDPRFRAHKGIIAGTAYDTVCLLLEPRLEPAMLPRIAPLLEEGAEPVRSGAAQLLAALAVPDGIEPVRRALADSAERVRWHALKGIAKALERDPAPSRTFLDGVFNAIKRAAGGDLDSREERPFELMLEIDREAAAAELLTDHWLRVDQPKLRHVLAALNKTGVLVDEARLYALEQGLRERHTEHPYGDAYRQVLLALALKRASEARARIEAAAGLADSELEMHAAYALAALSLGMRVEPWIDAQLAAAGGELGNSSEAVQTYADVKSYVNQVDNGGHAQFLFNPSGDRAQHTGQALKRIGANEAAACFDRVLAALGASPPTSTALRRDLLAQKIDGAEALLRECNRQVDTRRVLSALYRYLAGQGQEL